VITFRQSSETALESWNLSKRKTDFSERGLALEVLKRIAISFN